jgi:hypothetical protein
MGLWTWDLTFVTIVFSVLTLGIVLKQLSLMKEQSRLMRHQDNLMQRQTDILVRQDELLSRRAKLFVYVEPSLPGQVVVLCRNDGNKTAQHFYWHLSIPATVAANSVWDATGNEMLISTGIDSHQGEQYRHYNGLIHDPLYPTRLTPLARIDTNDMSLPLWWFTVSEDGADPTPDGKMQRMERQASKSEHP